MDITRMKKYINKQEYRDMVISSLIETDIDFTDIVSDEQIKYAGYNYGNGIYNYGVSGNSGDTDSDNNTVESPEEKGEEYYYIDGITDERHDIIVKEEDSNNFQLLHINTGCSGSSGTSGASGSSGLSGSSDTTISYDHKANIEDRIKSIQNLIDSPSTPYFSEEYMRKKILDDYQKEMSETQ